MSEITTKGGSIYVSEQLQQEMASSTQAGSSEAWAKLLREIDLHRQLKQTIAELELCSHVSAVSLDSSGRGSGEDVGGKRPPGGVDRKDDKSREGHKLKSAEHYKRRVAKARSEAALQAILKDAKESLVAWKRQPAPQDVGHPMPGDVDWKRWVGESSLSASEIARKCSVSGAYVRRIRAQYREREAA
jgi:hypothetical protein